LFLFHGGVADRVHNAVQILKDFSIPKAHDAPAMALKIARAGRVVVDLFLGVMGCTVDLNRKQYFEAGEVDNERSDRRLAKEFPALLFFLELPPEQAFCRGHALAHAARKSGFLSVAHVPHHG
jgi:hypothetical protein